MTGSVGEEAVGASASAEAEFWPEAWAEAWAAGEALAFFFALLDSACVAGLMLGCVLDMVKKAQIR